MKLLHFWALYRAGQMNNMSLCLDINSHIGNCTSVVFIPNLWVANLLNLEQDYI